MTEKPKSATRWTSASGIEYGKSCGRWHRVCGGSHYTLNLLEGEMLDALTGLTVANQQLFDMGESMYAEIEHLKAVILEGARMAERLKRECGMDPESPIAVQNSRYMGLSHFLRGALESIGKPA